MHLQQLWHKRCQQRYCLVEDWFSCDLQQHNKNTEFGTCPYIPQHILLSSDNFFLLTIPKVTSNLTSFMSHPTLYYLYVNELRGSSSVHTTECNACTLWVVEFGLFWSHSPSLLRKPKLDEPTCLCTGVHRGLLSSDSYAIHIHLH